MNLKINQSEYADTNYLPIGTILPFIGSLNDLPNNWQPCDGRLINNAKSPFNDKKLPELMDNRFLMGVSASLDVCSYGGNNVIPECNDHNHNGATNEFKGYQPGNINYDSGPDRQDSYMMRFGIDGDGAHNHGGENRPLFCGVYFIIRIL